MKRAAGLALACLSIGLLGCSDDPAAPGPTVLPGPAEWNRDVVAPSDAEASAARAACTYQAGALPAETQGASLPDGRSIPIDHVLVVMMENRSFDHYFQMLPEYGQPDVDVAPADFSNPDADGNPVPIFHTDDPCFVDTAHSWSTSHEQVAGGAMTGFVTSSEGAHENPVTGQLEQLSGARAMGYHNADDLPFYYWLASEFSIADRYFSSVIGPTFPNRMYLYAASSFGHVRNNLPAQTDTIVDLLEKRQVDWRVYADATPGIGSFLHTTKYFSEHLFPIEQYFIDAAAGDLPAFAFVDPAIGLATGRFDTNDEHPPAMPQIGQRWVAEVVDALVKSPNWARSAMFITYDEHGGLYDHVEPPPACAPGDAEPMLNPGEPQEGFDQLGIRVPMMVVSPYAKRHHVSHEVYDHTSITRFVEARFVLPAMSGRDANALAPWDMFDFTTPDLAPVSVPIPTVPQDQFDVCKATWEG